MAPPGGVTRPAYFGLCSENHYRKSCAITVPELCKGQLLIKEETDMSSCQLPSWLLAGQGRAGQQFVMKSKHMYFEFLVESKILWPLLLHHTRREYEFVVAGLTLNIFQLSALYSISSTSTTRIIARNHADI